MEWISGNIFIREMEFAEKGDTVEGHAHHFDHTTYVVRGAVQIQRLDTGIITEVRARDGKNWRMIKAGVKHRITALEKNSLCHCIYAHRNPQGEVVQRYEGWEMAHGTLR